MALPGDPKGRLGLGFVPGRRDVSRYTGARWARDLDVDLEHLREEHGVTHLVVVHGRGELEAVGVPHLAAEAAVAGCVVSTLVVEDEGTPDRAELDAVCKSIIATVNEGDRVAVVSRGGQGRTGLVVGAVLVALGSEVERALDLLRELRGPHCPHPAGVAFLRGDEHVASGVTVSETDVEADERADDRDDFADPPRYAEDEDDEDEDDEDDDDDEDEDEDEDDDEDEDEDEDDLVVGEGVPEEDDRDHDFREEGAHAFDDEPFVPSRVGGEGGGHLLDASVGEVSGTFDLTAPPEAAPPATQIALDPGMSRNVGAVLGAAIGDAIGHPTEFVGTFEAIREKWPPNGVTGFELWWDRGGQRFAPYTDDTQMAEIVLRGLLWSRDHDADLDATMKKIAEGFIVWSTHPQGGHRAPGNACLAGCRALAAGSDWWTAGGPTAGGCGSVMRAYPFGLIFAHDLERAERWSVEHSKLTHRDPIALAASGAMAVGVARVVRGEAPQMVASEMVAAACRQSPRTGAMMAQALEEALDGTPPEVTLKRLEGWAAHEAVAAAVYLFMRHPDDIRAAILEGANSPGDSDSLATLAGALVGARRGLGAIPEDWVNGVERSRALMALGARI